MWGGWRSCRGPRKVAGVILDIADQTEVPREKLRAIEHIQRDWPALTAADLTLFRFCASHHAIGAGDLEHPVPAAACARTAPIYDPCAARVCVDRWGGARGAGGRACVASNPRKSLPQAPATS